MSGVESRSTRWFRYFKALLAALSIAAIVGIAFSLSDIVDAVLDVGLVTRSLDMKRLVLDCITVLAWTLMLWIGVRAFRRNLMPPTWSILLVVALGWAGILINHVR